MRQVLFFFSCCFALISPFNRFESMTLNLKAINVTQSQARVQNKEEEEAQVKAEEITE